MLKGTRGVIAIAGIGAIVACQGESTMPVEPTVEFDKMAMLAEIGAGRDLVPSAPIAPIAHLEAPTVVPGDVPLNSIDDSALWDYYTFCATEGDVPDLEVHRTTSAMDPAMTIFFGTTDESDGLTSGGSTQPGMAFIAFDDDNNGIPHGVGGSFADPRYDGGPLPFTGVYTLAVYDFLGLGPGPTPYEIHLAGGISNNCATCRPNVEAIVGVLESFVGMPFVFQQFIDQAVAFLQTGNPAAADLIRQLGLALLQLGLITPEQFDFLETTLVVCTEEGLD